MSVTIILLPKKGSYSNATSLLQSTDTESNTHKSKQATLQISQKQYETSSVKTSFASYNYFIKIFKISNIPKYKLFTQFVAKRG